ncbi:MAG: cytochrome c [Bryobacteraceae bacterium]
MISLFLKRLSRLTVVLSFMGPCFVQGQNAGAPPQAPNPTVQTPSVPRQESKSTTAETYPPELVKNGQGLFGQNCGFCHGKDAGGGEGGPDLTRSQLVSEDVKGNKIGDVVRNGRPEKGMPRFNLPEMDMAAIVAFIHDQKTKAESQKGGRRGVDVADLQTGNLEAGKKYFAANCASCHSATGDLKGIASRLQGLRLEQRFLYPRDAVGTVTVTLPSGKQLTGKLAYKDEFVIGLKDSYGWYQSWPVSSVKFKIDDPAEAHHTLLTKYTDDDIHDVMAFLQTLK